MYWCVFSLLTAAGPWSCGLGRLVWSSCTPPPPSRWTAAGSAVCCVTPATYPECGWSVARGGGEMLCYYGYKGCREEGMIVKNLTLSSGVRLCLKSFCWWTFLVSVKFRADSDSRHIWATCGGFWVSTGCLWARCGQYTRGIHSRPIRFLDCWLDMVLTTGLHVVYSSDSLQKMWKLT